MRIPSLSRVRFGGVREPARRVAPYPAFTLDTFTDTAGTALTSHVGDLGATWSVDPGITGAAVITDANRIRSNAGGGGGYYRASGTPPSADYEASLDFVVVTTAGTVSGPCVRVGASPANGYIFFWNGLPNNQWELWKLASGSATNIANAAGSISGGTTYKMKILAVGTSIKCYVDGIEKISATDSSVSATGKPGIWFDGAISDSTGGHVDNFRGAVLDRQVVFDGNSLTYGTGSSGGRTYPVNCFRDLVGFRYGGNFGVSGQTAAQMEADAATEIDVLYNGSLRRNILVAGEGRNSIVVAGRTMVQAYGDLVTYYTNRRAAGWKVVAKTVLPSQGGDEPGGYETDRLALNALLLANWTTFADAIVDVASDARLSDPNDTTYFDADKVHLNNAGYEVLAGLMLPAINSL